GQEFDAQIEVASGNEPVIGVQAFLNYDPALLQVVSLTPGTALPSILLNSTNNPGEINFAAVTLQEPYPTGTFTLATVRLRLLTATSGTTLSFNRNRPRESGMVYFGGALKLDGAENGVVINNAPTLISPADQASTSDRTPKFSWRA